MPCIGNDKDKRPCGRHLLRGQACLVCRKKKLKCDGEQPACGQCVRLQREAMCTYESHEQWSKERQQKHRIDALEKTLQDTEGELERMRAHLRLTSRGSRSLSPESSTSIRLVPVNPQSTEFTTSHEPAPQQTLDTLGLINVGIYSRQDEGGSRSHSPSSQGMRSSLVDPPPSTVMSRLTFTELDFSEETKILLLTRFMQHASHGRFGFHLMDGKALWERFEMADENDIIMDSVLALACQTSEDASRCDTRFRQKAQFNLCRVKSQEYSVMDRVTTTILLSQSFYMDNYLYEARHCIQMGCRLVTDFWCERGEGNSVILVQTLNEEEGMILQALRTLDLFLAVYMDEDICFPSEMTFTFETASASNPSSPYSQSSRRSSSSSGMTSSSSLLSPIVYKKAPPVDRGITSALRAKAAHLLWQSFNLAKARPGDTAVFDHLFEDLKYFTEYEMPTARISKYRNPTDNYGNINFELPLSTVRVLGFAAFLQLAKCARPGGVVYNYCKNAAGNMEELIREVYEENFPFLDPIVGFCCRVAVEHLVLDAPQSGEYYLNPGDPGPVPSTREIITTLRSRVYKLAHMIPVVAIDLASIDEMLELYQLGA